MNRCRKRGERLITALDRGLGVGELWTAVRSGREWILCIMRCMPQPVALRTTFCDT